MINTKESKYTKKKMRKFNSRLMCVLDKVNTNQGKHFLKQQAAKIQNCWKNFVDLQHSMNYNQKNI